MQNKALLKLSLVIAAARVAIIEPCIAFHLTGFSFNHARQVFPSKNSDLIRTRRRSQFLEKRFLHSDSLLLAAPRINNKRIPTKTGRSYPESKLFSVSSPTITPSTDHPVKESGTSSRKDHKGSVTTNIVLVCGFESFNRELYNLAASKVPDVNLRVFADSDIRAGGSSVCTSC
jgi:hypothetical protein